MKLPVQLAIVLPLFGAALSAQTPDHLVGLTRNAPSLRHQSHAPCQFLAQCAVPLPNSAGLPPAAGGTAWDPTRSGAWVTNGLLLAKLDDQCNVMCPPVPIPTLGINAVITGMEVVEGINQLWMVDNQFNLHRYTNTCPATPLGVCNIIGPIIIGGVTTGLAVDELQGLVFTSVTQFPNGPSRVLVSLLANPCSIISQFQVPACAVVFGPVLGLACDWGNTVLYATDGQSTVAMNYVFAAPNVVVTGLTCCTLPGPAVDPMIGLAIRPSRATSLGQPCANGVCPPCPQNHTLRNDPSLGNAQFALGLDDAPVNGLAILAVGASACSPGVVGIPLCGPLHTLPLLGTVGPQFLGPGPTPCSGSTSFNIPLPVAGGLAGLVFSSQCVTVCFSATGAIGFGMSNCLSWRLGGN